VDLRKVDLTRETKETKVTIELNPDVRDEVDIATGVPFVNHLLEAMAFHGGFGLKIRASGDVDIDHHHLVEDIGLVLGTLLHRIAADFGNIKRFGYSVIPMDEALSEVSIDVCGRPTLVFNNDFPQSKIGDFDLCLIQEFLKALTNSAKVAVHAHIRYGRNSHHMAESLFKALGKALRQAYTQTEELQSTKGTIMK
jgi:imidazoleglycerol-phosphate dehydratase